MSTKNQREDTSTEPLIAIVGMACRLPGAPNIEVYWQNLRDGVESIRRLSDEELLSRSVARTKLSDPSYVKACPMLDDIDKFDASFFGFSPRDASVMDPAHRIFLQLAFQAFEHAGYTALPEEGKVGVFASAGAPLYMIENVRTNAKLMRSMGEFLVRHTGNDMSFLATRVSYELDLRGPSLNVQSACSSALVAVHLASQSLLRGECDMALAGGSTVLIPHGRGYEYREGEILSPDGHCRPFDERSAGTVFGSGAGCVVLKRLQDALDAGDTVCAVLRGSAINNDGALKVGYLAPSVDGQAECIDAALKAARIPAESVSYVEAHGTGTLVGDPIEVAGLTEAFRRHTDRAAFCAIGSVKSNIGHLGEAAGIASLIKAVLALQHRALPPSLGYERANPQIDFGSSPFFVNEHLRPWTSRGPLRCGVTALGAGGTNCHVILEEAPERIPGEGGRHQQLLVLSAMTRAALDQRCEDLATTLETTPDLDLADAAYTLSVGRRHMPHRRICVADSSGTAAALLRAREGKHTPTEQADDAKKRVVFLYPGGGAQYAGMGKELYECEEVYQQAIDACLRLTEPALGYDLRALMFADESTREQATLELERPSLTLPALFATEYALTQLFQSWGVTPVAAVGHSMGEYLAACLAGVMSLEDALRVVMLRGRLFEKVPTSGMLSVSLSEADTRKLMPKELDIAAVNAPDMCVASGPLRELEALEKLLSERAIDHTRVRIHIAAHSSLLDPVLDEFRALCRTIQLRPPTLPFVSNLTGRYIRAEEATDPEYWVKHLRGTVRFADCMQTLLADGDLALLELGPGRTLSTLARAQSTKPRCALSTMRHPQENASDVAFAMTALGRLWSYGVDVDFETFYDGQLRNRIPLPTYPFEGSSFWVEPEASAPEARLAEDGPTRHDAVDDWFYSLSYRNAPVLSSSTRDEASPWLVFTDGSLAAEQIRRHLRGPVVTVRPHASRLLEARPNHWELCFSSSNQFVELLDALAERGPLPRRVLFMFGLATSPERWLHGGKRGHDADARLDQSFFAPTYLARALGRTGELHDLTFVTTALCAVDGREQVEPLHAACLGPALVTPREFPQVRTRVIDFAAPRAPSKAGHALLERLLADLHTGPSDQVVAHRIGGRFVRHLDRMLVPATAPEAVNWLRAGGVYLITGGLGGIGLEIATHMAALKPIQIALLSRSGLPPEKDWDAILASGANGAGVSRIQKVREMQALGATVQIVIADVADRDSMMSALASVRRALGPISGVVHAAGVMDDEPMATKTDVAMRSVLAPKVRGTLVLDELIREPLDFFVAFSSVASVLGLPGQVDYTAANAFLDAFAQQRARQKPSEHTVVVNWNAWREVGMAVRSYAVQTQGFVANTPCLHPMLDGYSDDRGHGRVFCTQFRVADHWLLSEHRIKGAHALLPGTAFLELIRAAFSEGRSPGFVEMLNLSFLSPFQVADDKPRAMNLLLTPAGDALEVEIRTAGADPRTGPHVTGDVRAYEGPPPPALDLASLALRCNLRSELHPEGKLRQSFVDFGPRWANLVRTQWGNGEALIELRLPARFAADLTHLHLHPAVLDMATGGAQALIPGFDPANDFFVPAGYARVRVFAPMTDHLFSHVRLRPETGRGLAYFDVTLSDREGKVLATLEGFEMKRIDARSALMAKAMHAPSERIQDRALQELLRDAIAPEQGVEVFDRVMNQPHLLQTIASSVDVPGWKNALDRQSRPPALGDSDEGLEGFSRPAMESDYAAPTTPSEQRLASVWSELLGVRKVGIHDDFFDLGGNSLVAVRLFAAVRKQYSLSLPLSALFEAPTISQLAALLDRSTNVHESPAAQEALPDGAKQQLDPASARKTAKGYSSLVAMQSAGSRPPLFCAAGMGGNPLNLRALALLVGLDQPFYGLQPQGLDGESEPHTTVEEMAAHYLQEIRRVQPHGPYHLSGYSGGGIIAYEMALQLTGQGESVGSLAFLDSPAPVLPTRSGAERLTLHAERLKEEGLLYLTGTAKRRLHSEADRLLRFVRRPFAKRYAFELRFETIEDTWLAAAARYRPGPYQGDAMLFRAADGSAMPMGTSLVVDAQNGWGPYVLGGMEVIACPGGHNSMCEHPHVRVLARRLRAYLDRRMRGGASDGDNAAERGPDMHAAG